MGSTNCIFAVLITLVIAPSHSTGCHAFAPTHCPNSPHSLRRSHRSISRTTKSKSKSHTTQRQWLPHHSRMLSPLQAVTKRQTLILDGAELAYYIKSLASQQTTASHDHNTLPNLAPRSPQKRNRVGAITFVTATLDKDIVLWNNDRLEKGTQIIGIEAFSSSSDDDDDDAPSRTRTIISINQDLHLYQDSIAIIPSKVSPSDAISTAATSLLGVHCSSSSRDSNTPSLKTQQTKQSKKIVIVGGGDYALFLTRALVGLGNTVSLVSARPSWSLPSPAHVLRSNASSSKKNKKNEELVEILPPAVGPMSLGFAMAIGEFDTLIDTLGDELGIGRALTLKDNDTIGGRFLEQLKELHGCDNYLSTLTRSQQYVLKKGLLFARDPVIRYQNEVEKLTSKYQVLPPPSNFFGRTLQVLLDEGIIYSCDQNENGSHGAKENFVRGWSLSDMTELKTWPREGAGRFGFPVLDLSSPSVLLRRRKDAMAATDLKNEGHSVINADGDGQDIEGSTELSLTYPPSSSDDVSINHERVEEDSITTDNMMVTKSTANTTIKVTKLPSINKKSATTTVPNNPYVTTIHSVSDLNKQIIEPKRNCILFLTASYCQKCKRMTPQFNRIARVSSESKSQQQSDNVLFAHVDISNGPRGKQLGKVLGAEKVPSVIVFQKGERVKVEGDEASTVVERNNLNRLEDLVQVLASGERNVNVNALLMSSETAKK